MKRRRKISKLILLILVFFISIGFAYLSTQLSINGGTFFKGNSWDIHFDNVKVLKSSDESNPTPTISADGKTVEYSVVFNEPGDVFSFNVDVVNAGSLNAMVDTYTNDGLTTEQSKLANVYYKDASGAPIDERFILLHGNIKIINVTVEYKYDIDVEDLPDDQTIFDLSFSITYKQASKDIYTEASFKSGKEVNAIMKTLAAGTDTAYTASNSNITKFIRSDSLNENSVIASTEESEKPIYMWFDTDTIYYYTEANFIYLNEDSSYMFYKLKNLSTYDQVYNFVTSNVVNMENMFEDASYDADSFDLFIDYWDVSNVTNMNRMFCSTGFNSKAIIIWNLSRWNVSKVTDMGLMFSFLGGKTIDLNLSNWNTGRVTDMEYIFENLGRYFSYDIILDVSDWNINNVESLSRSFEMIGQCAHSLKIIGLGTWDLSNVKDIWGMFEYSGEFSDYWDIGDLSSWDISNIEDLESLFEGAGANCSNWSVGDLSNWRFDSTTSFNSMFRDIKNLNNISFLSEWDVSNITDMGCMFDGCTNLVDATALNNWTLNNTLDFSNMFNNTGLTSSTKPSWYTGNI